MVHPKQGAVDEDSNLFNQNNKLPTVHLKIVRQEQQTVEPEQ
jgi:hypothetical protein